MSETALDYMRRWLNSLEAELTRGEKHKCRNCFLYHCGGPGKCRCYCGQIRREQAQCVEKLRYAIQCLETGEVPNDPATQCADIHDPPASPDAVPVGTDAGT